LMKNWEARRGNLGIVASGFLGAQISRSGLSMNELRRSETGKKERQMHSSLGAYPGGPAIEAVSQPHRHPTEWGQRAAIRPFYGLVWERTAPEASK